MQTGDPGSTGARPDSRIVPPPCADRGGAALILVITVLVCVAPMVHGGVRAAVAAGIALATAVSAWGRSRQALSLGLFWTLVAASQCSGISYQQLTVGFSIAAYAAMARAAPWLGAETEWARRGGRGRDIQLLIAGAVVVSGAALVLWHQLTRPDLGDIVRNFIPDVAVGALLVGAAGFSMVNALVEEVAYRGVLMQALDAALGAGTASVVVQAVPFGLLHFSAGVPRGWIGVGLAMIYGVMMGVIRRRAQGMFAPWLAHVFTDMAIGGIMLTLAR